MKFQRNFWGNYEEIYLLFALIIFQKDMQSVTMELRDKNGGTINMNETLYKHHCLRLLHFC